MSISRRFLIAPALVRLIRKERGGSRITEGHFAPQGGRTSYVRVDGQACQLVLVNGGIEERTDVPRAHGDALLDVCPGKAAYDRTTISASGREIAIDRYVSPGALDLVTVVFDDKDQATAFPVPAWFAREVTDDAAFERSALAIQGVPSTGEMSLSNAALDAVLDLIEPRFGFGRYGSSVRSGENGEGSVGAMRRPAPAAAAPAPMPEIAPRVVPEPEPVAPAPVEAAAFAEPAPHAAEATTIPHPQHEAVAAHERSEAQLVEMPQPDTAHAEAQNRQPNASGTPAEAVHGDARIDDVIESLSAALGAAIHQNPAQQPEKPENGTVFERWTVRPRRSQTQG
jgi:CYTH domain-containing protein